MKRRSLVEVLEWYTKHAPGVPLLQCEGNSVKHRDTVSDNYVTYNSIMRPRWVQQRSALGMLLRYANNLNTTVYLSLRPKLTMELHCGGGYEYHCEL